MNGKFLLDTNIVIALFADDPAVRDQLADDLEVFIPSIVLGELFYGALKSTRVEANLARLDEFTRSSAVLGCDATTARYYGQIKNTLREKGRPIPENDIWIAAIAMQHGFTLATRDRHFDEVEGLLIEAW